MRSLVGPLAAALVVLTAAPAWAEPVNQAPVAVDDALVIRNTGGIDRLVDALGNDSDPDGDALTYTAVTPATKGNAFLQGGKLYYKAFLGNTGTDTFTYTVSDGHGNTATGTVTVTLWVDPDAPVVQSISSSAAGSATLTWSAAEGADTYRVYRNGVAVHTGPDLSWTDTGLIDSQGYEYRVSGINGGGWEGWKSEGTLYRRAQSPAPTGLAVSLTDDPTTLSLTWVGVDGGGPWHVYRDGALLTTTTHPQFRDSGLVTGREYSYQVRLDFTGSDIVLYVPSALSSAVRAAPAPLTAIGQYVWDHASTGSLGPVTVAERAIPGGRQQDHVRGIVLQQDGAGPVAVTTDFLEAYTAAGGVAGTLGFPLGDEECDHVVLDCVQVFDGGSIWDSQNTSAHVVPAVIEDGWAASGWEEGLLGYPTADVRALRGGSFQRFEGGAVYWSPAGGSHAVAADVHAAWGRSGWENGPLGYPVADEVELQNGGYQLFQGGSIYWSGHTDPQVVWGSVRTRWAAQGWERGVLGYPVSDEIRLRGGVYQLFEGGSVYWSPATGAHVVWGATRDLWAARGWENGYLGYPVTDEVSFGSGTYQNFQGGTVYWSSMTGARDVRGAIRDRYVAWGAEHSGLGLPISSEIPLRGGAYQLFWSEASVYWSPATGAHVVRSQIRNAWAGLGWENGRLGYPVGDEVTEFLVRRQDFARGSITFDVRKQQVTVTYR